MKTSISHIRDICEIYEMSFNHSTNHHVVNVVYSRWIVKHSVCFQFTLSLPLSLYSFLSPPDECSAWEDRGTRKAEAANLHLQLCAHVWLCVCVLLKVWVRDWVREGCRRSVEKEERDLADLSGGFCVTFLPWGPDLCSSVWKITGKNCNGISENSSL